MKSYRLVAFAAATLIVATAPTPVQPQGLLAVHVIFACDFEPAERGYTAALVQSSDPALVQGVEAGQRCVDALGKLLGRFAALRSAGANVDVEGPFFGILGEGDPAAGTPGCDIWDFASNNVDTRRSSAMQTKQALVGILTCQPSDEGPVVLGAESNRDAFVRNVEEGTPCAEAVAELSRRFHGLVSQRRTALVKITPLADRVLVPRAEDGPLPSLRYYFVAAFN